MDASQAVTLSLRAGEQTLHCFSCVVGAISPFPVHGCQQTLPCSPLYPLFPFFAPNAKVTGLGLACLTPAVGLDAFISTLQNIDSGNHMSKSNFYASETALIFCFCCLFAEQPVSHTTQPKLPARHFSPILQIFSLSHLTFVSRDFLHKKPGK